MKTPFKFLVLMLITSVTVQAQRHRVIQKSVEANKSTSVIFNLDNIAVAFEESTDGKIHFDYVMEFDGYSKKKMKSIIDSVSVEVSNSDNHITLKAKSNTLVGFETFQFETSEAITMNNVFRTHNLDSIVRKSKDSLSKELQSKNNGRLKNPLKYMNERFKLVDKNGKSKNITRGSFKIMRSQFVIKLPPFVKLTINAKNSSLYFRNDIQNELNITSNDGAVYAKSIANTYNKIKIEDANFEAESLIGGDFTFKNVYKGKVVQTEKVNINSEFSKIEIGEIGEATKITDFNSEYWFYNWTNDFKRFNLYAEYSKVHLFYPKANHSLKLVGNNTKSIIGKNQFEITMQPTRNGEKFTMMTKAAKDETKPVNEIFFDIIHGIIYTHEDSIKTINKD